MANVFIDESYMRDIADAIREKNGTEETYKPSQMSGAIMAIQSGGSSDDEWAEILKNIVERTIVNVVIPEGTTKIGTSAFERCEKLISVSLPEGITSINSNAFSNCTSLALTSLPATLNGIGSYAFQKCTSLALTSLPEGITTINNSTFRDCTSLALTSLPATLNDISSYAFQNCTSLALTSLPEGITQISTQAFRGCTDLTQMTFTVKPRSISSDAFKDCTNLLTINVPWSEGEVSNAPWGATNATINYNYVEPSDEYKTVLEWDGVTTDGLEHVEIATDVMNVTIYKVCDYYPIFTHKSIKITTINNGNITVFEEDVDDSTSSSQPSTWMKFNGAIIGVSIDNTELSYDGFPNITIPKAGIYCIPLSFNGFCVTKLEVLDEVN